MSKKGLISFVKDDKIKAVYVHRNAQLDKIGKKVVRICIENTVEELKKLYDSLILVEEDIPMTCAQIKAYQKYMPEQCWREDLDWTTALKYTKDATEPIRDGFPYVVDYAGFLPSWRNRFRYTIDLDREILKVVKGGLEVISQASDEFFEDVEYSEKIAPCVLAEFPLTSIPDNWIEICKDKWNSFQIVCLPWDEAAVHSNEVESDSGLQHSAKAMEFFMGIIR
jgi:hypothetical protein